MVVAVLLGGAVVDGPAWVVDHKTTLTSLTHASTYCMYGMQQQYNVNEQNYDVIDYSYRTARVGRRELSGMPCSD